MTRQRSVWARYKLRLRRKRLLWRAFRKRREFVSISRKTGSIKPKDILVFATMRNEMDRLPYFLKHYRDLGVSHFLIVDNGSTDGSGDYLAGQDDVSLWRATASYKAARFGMDWLTALQWRFGVDHWCLTVDADELLIYPHWETTPLPALTERLSQSGQQAMGTLMLDLYPKGSVEDQTYVPGQDPTDVINWFDPTGYRSQRQTKMDNLWVQGGARDRVFFANRPERAPTLNKIPLVFWQRGFVYVNSTHNALPVSLNQAHAEGDPNSVTGVLLHTKFLPDAAARAFEEQARREHFADPEQYQSYYSTLTRSPDLWFSGAVQYKGWAQLVDLGLMSSGKDLGD